MWKGLYVIAYNKRCSHCLLTSPAFIAEKFVPYKWIFNENFYRVKFVVKSFSYIKLKKRKTLNSENFLIYGVENYSLLKMGFYHLHNNLLQAICWNKLHYNKLYMVTSCNAWLQVYTDMLIIIVAFTLVQPSMYKYYTIIFVPLNYRVYSINIYM